MSNNKIQRTVVAFAVASSAFAIVSTGAIANENIGKKPTQGAQITSENAAQARAPARFLTSPKQLTDKIREVLQLPNSDIAPQGSGSANHPFTTKRASSQSGISPVDKIPWRATGKLFMKFGNDTFVCTASVIRKGLLVTAAHCVHNYGKGKIGFADTVTFEPARYENSRPFGTWTAKQWWVPKVYFDGTDVCSAEAPGIVCENDVAVIVIDKKGGDSIADVTGKYGFKDKNFGYVPFLVGQKAQITQLGYPVENFDGDKMIRTDSLGYHDKPHNVVIGSNQTGGSSGGPWLANFGVNTSFTGPTPTDNKSNQVIATTSWGFTSGTVKIQGASRFSKNTTYTIKSNIQSLVDSACGANAGFC